MQHILIFPLKISEIHTFHKLLQMKSWVLKPQYYQTSIQTPSIRDIELAHPQILVECSGTHTHCALYLQVLCYLCRR
nr:MAG TPA: hypothetical protein [Caudoviricetes sp.]